MNFLVCVISTLGSIHKKMVKKTSDLRRGIGWLGTERNFSLYTLSWFSYFMRMNYYLFKQDQK